MKTRKKIYAVMAALTVFAFAVFATPTAINSITPVGPYPASVGAGSLAVAFTAADSVNGNSVKLTGHEVLLFCNSDSASAHTVTITSIADNLGRTGDITAYSIPAQASGVPSCAAFSFLAGSTGWQQSDATVHFTANSALIYVLPLYVSR